MKIMKCFNWLYFVMSIIIIAVLLFFGSESFAQSYFRSINNIVIMAIDLLIIILLYMFIKRRKDNISDKKYKIILGCCFLLTVITQVFFIKSLFFLTGWDVRELREISDSYILNGKIGLNEYLTHYPNNILLTFILILIKSIPILGQHSTFISFVGAIQIDIAGLLLVLCIKRYLGNNYSLKSLFVIIPLILLSPWMIIPYSDSFAILYPILIFYLYSKSNKKLYDWFLIALFSFFGFYIKPTVLIVLMAIMIVEFINLFKNIKNIKEYFNKDNILKITMFIFGFTVVFLFNKAIPNMLKFEPVPNAKKINMIHYLAMGQNNETNGIFSATDYLESLENDDSYNIEKFKSRVMGRTIGDTITFYRNKILINYNDGSFSWIGEGEFFYQLYEPKHNLYLFMRDIYYGGKYYHIYLNIVQFIWIFVILCCPFIFFRKNDKDKVVLILSQIGITAFLLIFEARARYLYCYSPIIVLIGFLGYNELNNKIGKLQLHFGGHNEKKRK